MHEHGTGAIITNGSADQGSPTCLQNPWSPWVVLVVITEVSKLQRNNAGGVDAWKRGNQHVWATPLPSAAIYLRLSSWGTAV